MRESEKQRASKVQTFQICWCVLSPSWPRCGENAIFFLLFLIEVLFFLSFSPQSLYSGRQKGNRGESSSRTDPNLVTAKKTFFGRKEKLLCKLWSEFFEKNLEVTLFVVTRKSNWYFYFYGLGVMPSLEFRKAKTNAMFKHTFSRFYSNYTEWSERKIRFQ